ncbi:hypothetical protein [Janthinobacterium sp.]|uniref:hypothetical protein n=1 Tax=Janthinobacterium sp. TaxID=1871054 RepID=UPI0026023467|nr:hypothetical protein [Janthinobacterium sp.]
MKTFKQFLGEDESPQEAREFFERECKPFIDKAQGAGVFVRGTDDKIPTLAHIKLPSGRELEVGFAKVRKDRVPKDVPIEFHNAVEGWMQNEFGISGRAGSAFVVGDAALRDVYTYGEAHVVIPQGKFKFIWSPEVNDLLDFYNNEASEHLEFDMSEGDMYAAVDEMLPAKAYRESDLPGAIKSRNEIMVECEHLLMINLGEDRAEHRAIIDEIKEVLK